MIMTSSNFIFNFTNVCFIVSFLTNLLTGILFSTEVRVVVVAKLVILYIVFLTLFILASRTVVATKLAAFFAISFLTSFILASRVVLLAKLVISGILS